MFKTLILKTVIIIIILFGMVTVASATDYYVSLSGENTNDGSTLKTAWRTIDYAVDHVSAGDKIYVVPGNYGNEHVTITTGGTVSNPIKIQKYGDSGTILLTSSSFMSGTGIRISADYWEIKDFHIINYFYGVEVSGDNNILRNLEIEATSNVGGTEYRGIIVYKNNNLIENCVVHGIGDAGFGTGYRLQGDYNKIKNSIAYNMGHFGIAIDGSSSDNAVGNVVEGGEYYDLPEDDGIGVADATNTTIKNVLIHDTWQGIRGYDVSKDLNIINNVIYNTEDEGIYIKSHGAYVADNKISNWNLGNSQKTAIWSEAEDIVLLGNEMDSSIYEYRFHKRSSYTNRNTIIKNQNSGQFEIRTTTGISENPVITIEYTDGRTFSVDGKGSYTKFTIDSIGIYTFEVVSGVSNGEISGTVTDSTGDAIEGAIISANGYSDTSDAFGTYSLTLPVETTTVTVSNTGYQSQSQSNIEVLKDQDTIINFQLEKFLIANLNKYTAKNNFDEGQGLFSDRKYTGALISTKYQGLDWIQTICNDKQSTGIDWLTFDLNEDATIYVGYAENLIQNGHPAAPWLDDGTWTDTNEGFEIVGYEPLHLYSKTVKKGIITLGGNYGDSISPMYVVLVAPGSQQEPIKQAPILNPIEDKSINVGSLLELAISANDPDGDFLTYSTTTLPEGASFDTTTNTFSWTPAVDQWGSHQVHFEVTDGSLIDSEDINISVKKLNVVGEWHLDERNANIALDSSGNGNDGTINGPVWIEGILGNALHFDGLDDHIDVEDSGSLDTIDNEITLMAWVNTPIGTRQSVIEKWQYGTGVNEREFELDINTGGNVNFGLSGDGVNSVWLSSNNIIEANTWTHIAVTSDGTTMKIYINGVQDQYTALAPTGIYPSSSNLHIGQWEYNEGIWNSPFNGIIDEVRILNSALSADEVKLDYEAGLVDTTSPIHVNNAPILAPIGSKTVDTSQSLEITISATDVDRDILTYSVANLPEGASFDPSTQIFSWIPVEGQAGSYQVYFEVTDGSLIDSEDVTIIVNEVVTQKILFFDDMESNTNGWTSTGLWHMTANRSNSPSISWWYGDELTNNYNTKSRNSGYLISPSIDLTSATNPELQFKSWYSTESNIDKDKKIIQVSTDEGMTWVDLLQISDSTSNWNSEIVNLSDFAGKSIQIRFSFDTIDKRRNNYEGLYIDDVIILG